MMRYTEYVLCAYWDATLADENCKKCSSLAKKKIASSGTGGILHENDKDNPDFCQPLLLPALFWSAYKLSNGGYSLSESGVFFLGFCDLDLIWLMTKREFLKRISLQHPPAC